MTISRKTTRLLVAVALFAALILAAIPSFVSAAGLTRQLQFGMSGSDVSTLQAFLAEDTSVYPEGLVTGYFGPLTRAAIIKYQANHGIDQVGRVGPITLAAINAQMEGGISTRDEMAPVLSAVTVTANYNGAVVTFNTNEPTRGTVYYSTAPLSGYESSQGVTIGGSAARLDTQLRTAHSITIADLQPNTTYHYDVYVTDAAGNATVTWKKTFKTTTN